MGRKPRRDRQDSLLLLLLLLPSTRKKKKRPERTAKTDRERRVSEPRSLAYLDASFCLFLNALIDRDDEHRNICRPRRSLPHLVEGHVTRGVQESQRRGRRRSNAVEEGGTLHLREKHPSGEKKRKKGFLLSFPKARLLAEMPDGMHAPPVRSRRQKHLVQQQLLLLLFPSREEKHAPHIFRHAPRTHVQTYVYRTCTDL